MGHESRPYTRAVTVQKCVRAGGKHNDLENVGYTARHHTFFEMMGNFSFGDYFKKEAILYAWEFLTSPTWLHLSKERLWVTVYASDDDAFNIWHQDVGLSAERIIRIGDNKGSLYASDNFWTMGDTGPCGPCSEVFYDHGGHVFGGPPGSPEEDGDRYVEIWNCVFMQFNRDDQGVLHALPKPSVDTGMGLERVSAVMQGVESNYDIDLFQSLIRAAARHTHTQHMENSSLKVIADHIRACCFLIADGVAPSNDGRGYVLRRIIRRALRHGHKLGQDKPFFHLLVDDLIQEMGEAYPELVTQRTHIQNTLLYEAQRFGETLQNGMDLLNQAIQQHHQMLPGDVAFKLYDTYGFPVDLTADIVREHDMDLDMVGFEQAMKKQRARARDANQFKHQVSMVYDGPATHFMGYETQEAEKLIPVAFFKEHIRVDALDQGEEGWLVLNKTPAYAESGGQIGDQGELSWEHGHGRALLLDTQKLNEGVTGHHIRVLQGNLSLQNTIHVIVNTERRTAITRHHSATHLLHAALQSVLGEHVVQRGSLVSETSTRFDFSHPEALQIEQIEAIEQKVNAYILANIPVQTRLMSKQEAENLGAMALFGEKYGDTVRVLQMGEASVELCGGTHVTHTGDIGFFRIISEAGISAGVRRIEAQAGLLALHGVQAERRLFNQLLRKLKAQSHGDIPNRVQQLQDQLKEQGKHAQKLEQQLALTIKRHLDKDWQDCGTIRLLSKELEDVSPSVMRFVVEQLRGEHSNAVVVLASHQHGKASLMMGVNKALDQPIHAEKIIETVAPLLGGKGGGRPDFAQAGGKHVHHIQETLTQITKRLCELC